MKLVEHFSPSVQPRWLRCGSVYLLKVARKHLPGPGEVGETLPPFPQQNPLFWRTNFATDI